MSTRLAFAIHVVPLQHTLFANDIDDYRGMSNAYLSDLAHSANVHMIAIDDDRCVSEADWNPDGEDCTAVFVCSTEQECRDKAYDFLWGERALADQLHGMHAAS